uniref:Semialdhyde_dh domain-containing protein n=1 Tax=Caenorhabditis japonica TaxID=281687 RepID=A0A8R1EJY6_CAEJA
MSSAFIVGASGAVGSELVALLADSTKFSKIILFGRRSIDIPNGEQKFVQKQVNFDKLEENSEDVKGVDVAFCALGTTRAKSGVDGFYKVDHDYVLNTAKLAKENDIFQQNYTTLVHFVVRSDVCGLTKDTYTTILEWSAIGLQAPNRTETGCGYKIFIYISETATEAIELEMPVQRLSDRRNPSARLDGLKLMYMYTIKVAGYNPGGVGPISAARSIRLGSPGSMDWSSGASGDRGVVAWAALVLLIFLIF